MTGMLLVAIRHVKFPHTTASENNQNEVSSADFLEGAQVMMLSCFCCILFALLSQTNQYLFWLCCGLSYLTF
jgi:hypothetical protein